LLAIEEPTIIKRRSFLKTIIKPPAIIVIMEDKKRILKFSKLENLLKMKIEGSLKIVIEKNKTKFGKGGSKL